MSAEKYDTSIKAILLGEMGVGKTNLIRRAMGLEFDKISNSNFGGSYSENDIVVNGVKYSYKLWDTAGQEQFRSLNKLFIKDSKIIIIVFAINDYKSFTQVDFWLNYAKEILGNSGYILGLVGNKSDLYDSQEIEDNIINVKVKELGIKYKLTSAAMNSEFKIFLNELLTDYIKKYLSKGFIRDNSFIIDNRRHNQKKKGFLQSIKNCFK